MANIKSQIKRNRQNDKRRLRNRAYRGSARIAVKNARSDFDAAAPESKVTLMAAISALDKAVEKGVIHKNNAARRKSRLMKAFAKVGPVKAVEAQPAMEEPVVEAETKKKMGASRKASAKAEVEPEIKAEPKSKKATAASGSKKAAAAKAVTPKNSTDKPSSKGGKA